MRTITVILISVFALIPAVRAQRVDFRVTTYSYSGQFRPKNCAAIWVTDASDRFIKSLKIMGQMPGSPLGGYRRTLVSWIASSNSDTTDAVTAATNRNHGTRTASWDCTDLSGNEVPDGNYRIHYEMTENNSHMTYFGDGPTDYVQFTKGAHDQVVNGAVMTFDDKWPQNPDLYGVPVKVFDNARVTYTAPAVAPVPGTVALRYSSYIATEDDGAVTVTATRTGGTDGAVSVSYATANGTAAAGQDYTAGSGTLSWADGDGANKMFTVNITDDGAVESSESFTVSISGPAGGATLGSPNSATVIINDNDVNVPVPGAIALNSATYSVNENSGSVTVTAVRSGGSDGAVSVSYATGNGTAAAGTDYTAASGTLTWNDGQSGNRTFTVNISDDADEEQNETFSISLSSVTGGASMGSPSTATVSINDNDKQADPSGLVGHWTFDNTTADASTAGNDGVWGGTGTFVDGYEGQAISSDGSVDGPFVQVEHSASLDGMDALSVGFWARKHVADEDERVVWKHECYRAHIRADGFVVTIYQGDAATTAGTYNGTGNDDAEWHHYGFSYDGAELVTYIDGKELKRTAATGAVNVRDRNDLYLGKNPWGESFNGMLDEVMVYRRALDSTEVAVLAGGAVSGVSRRYEARTEEFRVRMSGGSLVIDVAGAAVLNGDVTVFDAAGSIVFSKSALALRPGRNRTDVSLNPGLHIVRITDDVVSRTDKVLVIK